jgi:ABC-type multidrug transport system ATPase subunit
MLLIDVGKRYGRRWVLRSIDLEVASSSLTVVRGANGSGKSTLLRLVAGVSRVTTGTVCGRPERVAVVPDRLVPPRMGAREYLRHLARLRGLHGAGANRRIDELGHALAIAPGLDVPLRTMSRGNLQKVALAQAFLSPLGLVVLDEPHAALDDAAVEALRLLVAEARADGAAVVVADHGRSSNPDATEYELLGGTLVRTTPE